MNAWWHRCSYTSERHPHPVRDVRVFVNEVVSFRGLLDRVVEEIIAQAQIVAEELPIESQLALVDDGGIVGESPFHKV